MMGNLTNVTFKMFSNQYLYSNIVLTVGVVFICMLSYTVIYDETQKDAVTKARRIYVGSTDFYIDLEPNYQLERTKKLEKYSTYRNDMFSHSNLKNKIKKLK